MASSLSALCLHAGDDVGVVTKAGSAGEICTVHGPDGHAEMTLVTDVPFGHKVAIRFIQSGKAVVKYGQAIGFAGNDIAAGSHVHIHNLLGLRCAEKEDV